MEVEGVRVAESHWEKDHLKKKEHIMYYTSLQICSSYLSQGLSQHWLPW